MNLIDRISGEADLISFLDHVAKTMAARSLPLKLHKQNSLSAELLDAKDWNTALGVARKQDTHNLTHCKRCSSLLHVNGGCTDIMCHYFRLPQHLDMIGENGKEMYFGEAQENTKIS